MKIKDRGFWVSALFKYQSLIHWAIYAVYFRSLTYFSAANPKIYLGGMLDDRKSEINRLVPTHYLPKTIFVSAGQANPVKKIIAALGFPLVIKPDIGYKGFMVRKVDDESELITSFDELKGRDVLIQEFLCEKKEYSIMYYRLQNEAEYGITSLVEKHLPQIVGDGASTIGSLIDKSPNPFLNKKWILKKYENQIMKVPAKDQKITIDHVGNYSRGSKFENLNEEIDQELIASIHNFFKEISGINFGRLDVKAHSMTALKKGDFRILEINGAKSEPLHIYDPQMSLIDIITTISQHWQTLFRVVKENIASTNYPSSMEGIRAYRSLKKIMSE